MLRLLRDENFNGHVVAGLLARQPEIDLVRVQDTGLMGATDREILAWAANESRIVLTHDARTYPGHVYERVAAGLPVPGVFIFKDHKAVGPTVDFIEVVCDCSSPEEWTDRAVFFPW